MRPLFTWCVLACIAVGANAEGTSQMPNAEAIELPRDFFPILPWDPLHGWKGPYVDHEHGLESIAECAFTIGGFVQARDLPLCEKLGLKAIMFGEHGPVSRAQWKTLSDEEIDVCVKAMVDEAGNSGAILGYYIVDEPGASLFTALGKAVAAVKKYAPGKLAYINLFPGYATIGAPDMSQLETESFTEYLERYVEEVKPQFLSYDNYMVQYSQDLKDAGKGASYYHDLLEVRRVASKYSLPFWNIVSSNQIRPFTTIPSPANLLFQAYTTLAAGGRGVTWYTYYARGYGYAPFDDGDHKTATYGYVQMVNRQIQVLGPIMTHLTSTGVYFTQPSPVEGLPPLPGRLVTSVDCDVAIMVGEFEDEDGADYIMAVNLSLERSIKIVLKKHDTVIEGQTASPETGLWIPIDHERGLWLVAGQGVLVRLS